ncbi:hypothetical protein [Moorena sp. SIO4G3]|uniref:hypothetical protein n=1 Tax=Moorena sp. SIO4G3 TaxID=2607821 RepID=UPI00142CC8AB|nr:hypothetical protein [Moorena sp. SIO4G3]NEO76624.1 hypothetical protein [Moorena sp. SIO4G3]
MKVILKTFNHLHRINYLLPSLVTLRLSVSIQPSAVSRQRSVVSGQRSALWHRLWPRPKATLREWPRCANDAGTFVTIKQMVTCFIQKLNAEC